MEKYNPRKFILYLSYMKFVVKFFYSYFYSYYYFAMQYAMGNLWIYLESTDNSSRWGSIFFIPPPTSRQQHVFYFSFLEQSQPNHFDTLFQHPFQRCSINWFSWYSNQVPEMKRLNGNRVYLGLSSRDTLLHNGEACLIGSLRGADYRVISVGKRRVDRK